MLGKSLRDLIVRHELPGVLAQHLLDGSDPGRQAEALKRAVHIWPSRLKGWRLGGFCRT
jgi:hypothetical protein